MFTVEVKTNKSWNLRNVNLEQGEWTQVPIKPSTSQKEVEQELSWLALDLADSAQATIGFQVNYRILNGTNIVYEK